MTDKARKALLTVAAVLVWVAAWQISAMIIDREYFLPDVPTTLSSLAFLLSDIEFYKICAMTLLRVLAGLSLGTVLGIILAVLSHHSKIVYHLVSPIISVIKATPIASFIIILWILLSGDSLSIFASVIMVMPIIWQNLIDGYASIDRQLLEVTYVFEFSFAKRFKLLTLPALTKYFVPAFVTSVGLGWKAEIAAEIIAYTKNSIGREINDAKYNLNTAEVFAWTLVVVIFSIAFEKLTAFLVKRYKERYKERREK